jgi:thiamine-monophosphate kinase
VAWDELELHHFLAAELLPARIDGRSLNHDAVVQAGRAFCCDRTEEGVHFLRTGPEAATWDQIARKAVGRAVSDLAATAAQPTALLAAIAAPRALDQANLQALLRAIAGWGAQWGAPLLGGDLTAVPDRLSIVITALGDAPPDPPGRDRLQVGDVLAVSGALGGSRGGRHLAIEPRVALGQAAHAKGVRAMMDVSDGLALDAARLARASNMAIELVQVPVHPDVRASAPSARIRSALFEGEDHELLLGLPGAIALEWAHELNLIPIGRVTDQRDPGLWLARNLVEGQARDLPDATGDMDLLDPQHPNLYLHGRDLDQ